MKNTHLGVALLIFMALLSSATYTFAEDASFDCAKAASPIEKIICFDIELPSLSDSLSAAYALALNTQPDGNLKKVQREWLPRRKIRALDHNSLV